MGRFPLSIAQVMGAVPVAARGAEYATFIIPSGKVVVVMAGGLTVVVMVMDNALVAEPMLLLALTTKLNTPSIVGVPEIVPFA